MSWSNTRLLQRATQVSELKQQPGKAIYLVGGGRTVATLIDAGLVDELRLTVHPMLVAHGKSLFEACEVRRPLKLKGVRELAGGQVGLTYAFE